MISTAVPPWKKRFVVMWYDFIKSETAHDAVRPIITRSDSSNLTNEVMTEMIIDAARAHGVPEECWEAVIRYYSAPRPELTEIIALIEPITTELASTGIVINVSKHTTQAELEEYIRINYSKVAERKTDRMHIPVAVRKIQIVNKRLVHKLTYKEIAEYLLNNGVDMEEANIRSIVANHRKSMK